eukprot:scaffold11009_cov103-Isochrysis_galbana.AAC.3
MCARAAHKSAPPPRTPAQDAPPQRMPCAVLGPPRHHPFRPIPPCAHTSALIRPSCACNQSGRLLTTPATPAAIARRSTASPSTTHTSTGIPIPAPSAPKDGMSSFADTLHPLHRTPRAASKPAVPVKLA